MPVDLHSYFFFDGERIEKIVQPTQEERSDLRVATKKLIGIEILERAIRHLDSTRKELEKELKGIGDPETKKLISQKEQLEDERDGHVKNKKQQEQIANTAKRRV